MENGAISDRQINASSQLDSSHAGTQARLHFTGSWSAGINDVNQWLQIDIGSRYTNVTRVATQGRNGNSQWVTKYKIQYSHDEGDTHQYYRDQGQTTDKVKYKYY